MLEKIYRLLTIPFRVILTILLFSLATIFVLLDLFLVPIYWAFRIDRDQFFLDLVMPLHDLFDKIWSK